MSFDVHLEWGEHGARSLAAASDVLVVADVLSFSTAVDVALSRGATVIPFGSRDPDAATALATREHAWLAINRGDVSARRPYSLSPATLMHLQWGARLVLPSPNGSALSVIVAEHGKRLFAGCLRNAASVAAAAAVAVAAASPSGGTLGIIAAGERWPDGSLRPAIEDLLGAGAILSALGLCRMSPEAELAANAFEHARDDLLEYLATCQSGRELIDLGFREDVQLAAECNVSTSVPVFSAGAYRLFPLAP